MRLNVPAMTLRKGYGSKTLRTSLVNAGQAHAYNTGASVELSENYVGKARPIVQSRLAQAGIRLAWLYRFEIREKPAK